MNKKKNEFTFNQGTFSVYDSDSMPYQTHQQMTHFALTDALITYAGEKNQPIIHFWQTNPTAILGMMDTQIGHFEKGLEVLAAHEHDYMIRNSGGLAVVTDPGVLNVSLIYPAGQERLSIDEGYQWMLDFVRETFYPDFPYDIKAYEITNSYCFGDFDLSIEGRKIAGISQRRIQNGIAIMMYVSVNGDQQARAEMLEEFYIAGLDGSEPAGRYPKIDPQVMTTLADEYATDLSVSQVKKMMLRHFDWEIGPYSKEIDAAFAEGLEKMTRRNTRVFGEDFVK